MTEKQYLKQFSEGDRVLVTVEGVEREGKILCLLSSQIVIMYDNFVCDFFFYTDKPKLKKL